MPETAITPASEGPSITAAELARRVGGRLTGDGARQIRAVATLAEADETAVSWVGRPELLRELDKTRAGVVLVPDDAPAVPGRTLIHVADPDMAACAALAALCPPVPQVPPGIDPAARVADSAQVAGACIAAHVFVGPEAIIGAGTQLHPGVYVGARSRLGRACVLWPNAVVRERCTLGDRVIIHPNATIGADGFGYHQRRGQHHKIPQIGSVVIEDDVEIGAGTCIDRARSGETRIGRGTKIDNLVQIGHNVRLGEHCIVVALCGISGSTTVGHHVMFGGQAAVADHVRIGDNVVLAGRSGVTKSLPGGRAYRGFPAIEHVQGARQEVAIRRLPRIIEQLKALTKRIEQLESAAHNRT
jgi:UDP-3-O-[3-hydroxymyristoyl] glucosamine N-acyltransferase